MKRTLLACIVFTLLLTSCSGILYTIQYADRAGSPVQKINEPPPSPPEEPSPEPADPSEQPLPPREEEELDIDEAIERTDESFVGEEAPQIPGFSVAQSVHISEEPDNALAAYDHYIPENEERYRAFIGSYPDMPETKALALVNVNADFGYYHGVTQIEDPAALLVFCNKNFQLPSGYVPQDLRFLDGYELKMDDAAATAFENMVKSVKNELGLKLIAVSAYRSFDYQKGLFARYAKADGEAVAETYSARAGHSEHQTGLTIDLLHTWPSSGSLRRENFQNTEQYAWMLEHAHEYGYILRYPEGDESVTGYLYEPWHWRYIGVEDATRMFEAKITTFEEYIGTYYRGTTVVVEAG